MTEEWISVREAAGLVGYRSVDYFRKVYCSGPTPLLVIRIRATERSKRILVLRSDVEQLLLEEIKKPA